MFVLKKLKYFGWVSTGMFVFKKLNYFASVDRNRDEFGPYSYGKGTFTYEFWDKCTHTI